MPKGTLEIMLFKGVFAYAYARRHCRHHVVSRRTSMRCLYLMMLMLKGIAKIIRFKGVFAYAYAKRHSRNHHVSWFAYAYAKRHCRHHAV